MFKDRIFNIAISISIAWHIFWLSIITVVVTPKEARPIKFSKVSFLGPILEKGALEVRIGLRERSLLERRLLLDIKDMDVARLGWSVRDLNTKEDINEDPYISSDERLIDMVEDALVGSKLEPSYSFN